MATAADVHWNNAAGGNWNVAANWLPAAVPTATDTAVIDLAGTYTVTMNVNPTIAALRISGAASGVQTVTGTSRTFSLPNASSVGAQGNLVLATCTVSGAGAITNEGSVSLGGTSIAQALTNAGTLTITPGTTSLNGTYSNAGGATLRVQSTTGGATCTIANGFTNNGAIELTSSGGTGLATLNVTNGTLVNSASATISALAGSGGSRALTAQLDNQGTITVAATTTTNKASVDHLNSGTIDVTGGNYTVIISGTTPSFTTTGTISVASGRTLNLNGNIAGGTGQPYNFNAGTLGGAGTVSLTNATLVLNVPMATSSTQLDPSTSTINGPSTLTVSTGTTLTLTTSTLNAPTVVESGGTLNSVGSDQLGTLTNSGTFTTTGASTSNGSITTQSSSVIRVFAGSFIVANGFTNSAAIELTALSGATSATLTVTSGALTNSSTGTIASLPGTGGSRFLNAELDNQGTITVAATTTTNKASVDHLNSGIIDLTTGDYTVIISGATPSFTTTGTISVASGRTLNLNGNIAGGTGQVYNFNAGTLGGAGTVSLTNATLVLNAPMATSSTQLDPSTSTINGPSTLTVSTGTTLTLTTSTLNAPTVVETGGTLNSVGSDQLGTLTNSGTFTATGASTSNGSITTQSGSTIRVFAGSFIVANGFTNSAAIELTALSGATSATLTVSSGTLTNSSTGTISSLPGTGGSRFLHAELDNQGTITVAATTTTNVASVDHLNSGIIDLTTGNYTVVLSGATPSFTTTGTISVASGRTLNLNGNIAGGTGQVYNFNAGTLGGAGTVSLTNSTLVLGASLATSMAHLDPTDCTINGPGTLTVSTGTTLTALFSATGTKINAPTVVESGGTLVLVSSDQLGTLTNGGVVEARGGSTSNGLITTQAGSMLRVHGAGGTAIFTVANGFTNSAAIELISSGGPAGATLIVTSGFLVNTSSGTITSQVGTGGLRGLYALLQNSGLITTHQNLVTTNAPGGHSNSGTINLTTGNYQLVVSGAFGNFTTTGTINVPSGRTLTLQGDVVGGANRFHNLNGGTLSGGGTVSVLNATLVLNQPFATSMAGLVVNQAAVNGPDTLTVSAGTTATLFNSTLNAHATVASSGTLRLHGAWSGDPVVTHLEGVVTNHGLVEVLGTCTQGNAGFSSQPGSTFRLLGSGTTTATFTVPSGFSNAGTLELTTTGGAVGAVFVSTVASLLNTATGTISVLPGTGGARQILAHLGNSGLMDVQANLLVSKAGQAHSNEGTVNIAATRTLTVAGTSFTNFPSGVIQGSGTLTPQGATTFSQQGTIRPGASPGTLRVNGEVACSGSPVLDAEIGGDNPGTGYDQLSVVDSLRIGGTLNISVVNGYQPVPGKRYVIATCDGRTGTFATLNGLGYGVGQMWAIAYSDSDIVLLAMDETWSRVFADGAPPTPREGHTAVYDSTGDRMTVFGGRTDAGVVNEVWVLSKAVGLNYPAWTQLAPTGTPPPARTNASAVYDPASNRMIVFGGDDGAGSPAPFGDVWVLTNANGLGGTPAWTQLSPTGTPPAARSAHAAAYDALDNRMIVVGGETTPGTCGGELADVWVLENASGVGGTPAWSQLAPTGTPPSARVHHGAAYDHASGRLIVVGGDACGVANTEVWHLDQANGLGGTPAWSVLAPTLQAPAGWTLARYAFDSPYEWLDGFGGKVGATLADTAFTLTDAAGGAGASWHRRLAYGDRPAPRTFHSMILATESHTAVVFGGLTATGRTNDVWRRQTDRGAVLDADPPPTFVPQHTSFALPPSPNPARGAVTMALDIASEQKVDLAVFDLAGRRVETLHSGVLPAGRHTFHWGDATGSRLSMAPGVYLVRMSARDRSQVRRVVRF